MFLTWNRLYSVPNPFECLEMKVIILILSVSHFFKHTAIISNTTVGEDKDEESG